MKKRTVSLLLVSTMALALLSGCGNSEPQAAASSSILQGEDGGQSIHDEGTDSSPADGKAADSSASARGENTYDGEITNIKVALCDIAGVSKGGSEIAEKMNELSERDIGVHADITFMPFDNYGQQIGLVLASGDDYDLATNIPVEPATVASMYANGQLMDMTSYLEEEGSDLTSLLGDYLDAYRIYGGIYGVPTYRDYGSSVYLIMRKDVLEDLGLLDLAKNLTSYDEIDQIFEAVKENTDLTPVGGNQLIFPNQGCLFGGDNISDARAFDTLTDTLSLIYTDKEGNVSSLVENAEFRQQCERVKSWYDKGYIYKDSTITQDHPDVLMKAGTIFSSFQVSEIGVEVSKQSTTGYEVVCTKLLGNMLGSSYVAKFGTVLLSSSREPEAAVRWLNYLYSSPDMMNLLDWGVEGTDYQVVDGEATFVGDQDATTVRYHNKDYITGNAFLAYPWQGQGADFREQAREDLQTFEVSPYLGFTPDTSGMNNLLTSLNSVYMQYHPDIFCGNFDDDSYQAYVSALKTAGLDEYISTYQEQLTQWLATR